MNQKFIRIFLIMLIFNNIQTLKFLEENDEFVPKELFNKEVAIIDTKTKVFKETINTKDVVDNMGLGWNLGNTLDAWNEGHQGVESETCWGNPTTTRELIEELHKKGFKSIRLPTTWKNHLIDENYTIDPEWMKRVKEIVDWCIEFDLYVILNDHHDNADLIEETISYGSGYFPLKKDLEESERFIYNIWKQIALAFNTGYDHHLIFEALNEPRLKGYKAEWSYKKDDPYCEEACEVLNKYLQVAVNAIRETEGNNYKRFIMITPLSANYNGAMKSSLVFPNDKFNPTNRFILSVHMYEPYDFTMSKDITLNVFKDEYKSIIDSNFKSLYDKYVQEGYKIIIGEFGARDKNNMEDRIKWGQYYIQTARQYGISCVIWDNGNFKKELNEVGSFYALLRRKELEWYTDELVDAYIKAAEPNN